MGPSFDYVNLLAWSSLTGNRIAPEDVPVMRRLYDIFLDVNAKKTKSGAKGNLIAGDDVESQRVMFRTLNATRQQLGKQPSNG